MKAMEMELVEKLSWKKRLICYLEIAVILLAVFALAYIITSNACPCAAYDARKNDRTIKRVKISAVAANNTYDYNTSSWTAFISTLTDAFISLAGTAWTTLGILIGVFFSSQPANSPWILVFMLVIVITGYVITRRMI